MIKVLVKKTLIVLILSNLFCAAPIFADKYRIDTLGGHASVNFKIKHLGYSWLTGRFDKFEGYFEYDEKAPEKSLIKMTVKTKSIDSAHALRDTHLRGAKYLNVKKYPEARFVSNSFTPIDSNTARLTGKLSLHGVTRDIDTTITRIGGGEDPWGGYRQGFETHFKVRLTDYGIKHSLGEASNELQLSIYLEGVKESLEDGEVKK
ncbi:MAG: polyisoprenoid-binding protein YceI [Cocleimonas sp.]|jgi:polyisoprenoid-binding protein YceI